MSSDTACVLIIAIIAACFCLGRWAAHREIMKWGQKPTEKEETEGVDQ